MTSTVHYTPQIESALTPNNLNLLRRQILKHLRRKHPLYKFELSIQAIHHYITTHLGDLQNHNDLRSVGHINSYVFGRIVPNLSSTVYAQEQVRFVNQQQFQTRTVPKHVATGLEDIPTRSSLNRLHTNHHSQQYRSLQTFLNS